jgi:hypothetical protein
MTEPAKKRLLRDFQHIQVKAKKEFSGGCIFQKIKQTFAKKRLAPSGICSYWLVLKVRCGLRTQFYPILVDFLAKDWLVQLKLSPLNVSTKQD